MGQQNNFLYWSVQVKAILNAKRVWHFVRGEDVANSYVSNQNGKERKDTATGGVMDDEYGRNVECSVNIRGICKVPFACVMNDQDDPRRM